MSAPLCALLVLASWAILGTLLIGIGRLTRLACGWRSTDALGDVWIGYAATLVALQLWHLVAPIDGRAFVAFSILGVAGLLVRGARLGRLRARLRGAAFGFSFLLVTLLAYKALTATTIYDTGLYHLSSVRWLREAPIVTGLANVHLCFARNNASFFWNALVAVAWDGIAIHVAQGVLFLPLIARAGIGAARLLIGKVAPRPAHLFWPIVAILVFHPRFDAPAAFTPDHVVALLSLELVARLPASVRGSPHDRRLVFLLAVTLITVKLSGAIAAVGCATLLLATARRTRRRGELVTGLVLGLVLLVPWCARGVVVSGYPMFPSTIARFDVDWAVAEEKAAATSASTRSWARAERVDPSVLRGWGWVTPWLHRHHERSDLLMPFAFAAVAVLAAGRRPRLTWAAYAPPVLVLVSWFLVAPDPRFVHGFIWGLPALVAGEALCAPGARKKVAQGLAALAVALWLHSWHATTNAYLVSFESFPPPSVEARTTRSGLVVNVPRWGDQTWDAPLPCAPAFDPDLALRDPADAHSGFVLAPRRE